MKSFSTLLVALLFSTISFAKVWRVNNIPNISADFISLQAAHDAPTVANGDTLHLEPSATNYGDLKMTKRLTIISIGDFLSVNPNQQYSAIDATMNSLTASTASASGSVFHCNFSYGVSISNANNMRFERCHIGTYGITFVTSSNNVILNCFVNDIDFRESNNNLVSNNIVATRINMSYDDAAATIVNNVFAATGNSNCTIRNSIFQNNIINNNLNANFVNCTVQNNLAKNNNLPAGNNNVNAVNMTSVFVSPTGSDDVSFKLQTAGANPAKAAGVNGVDCGAYGGLSPYKPGLQAAIPAIYKLSVPATASGSTMNVTFSTKSNN